MPLSKAKALMPLWDKTLRSDILSCGIGTVLSVFLGFSLLIIVSNKKKDKSKNHIRSKLELIIVSCICIFSFSVPVCNLAYISTARIKNVGAICNVSAYYKMKHLNKIYNKLPSSKSVNKKTFHIGSINKAFKYKKDTLTKSRALKEYKELKHAYRHGNPTHASRGVNTTVNNTKSLHPVKPRWWNYIWE